MTYKPTCPICHKPYGYDTLKAYWFQNCMCKIPQTVDEPAPTKKETAPWLVAANGTVYPNPDSK